MFACNFMLPTKFGLHFFFKTYNTKSSSLKMRQKTIIAKLSQSVTEVYYKVCQVLQSASGITKCDRLLLQSET